MLILQLMSDILPDFWILDIDTILTVNFTFLFIWVVHIVGVLGDERSSTLIMNGELK
jgi:hypothetical protein